jgi:quercetin dioxygenase-like cupin family protein/quinol monooxygenase YgiN
MLLRLLGIDAGANDCVDSAVNEPGTRRFELMNAKENRVQLDEAYDDQGAFGSSPEQPPSAVSRAVDEFAAGSTSPNISTWVEGGVRRVFFINPEHAKEPREMEREHFIGRVTMQRFGEGMVSAGVDVVVVFFESGARTRPHVHATDQVLHFISGTGFVALPGEGEHEIPEGAVFIVPAGALHMHGATSGNEMCHLAVKASGETDWEPVLPSEWNIWRKKT